MRCLYCGSEDLDVFYLKDGTCLEQCRRCNQSQRTYCPNHSPWPYLGILLVGLVFFFLFFTPRGAHMMEYVYEFQFR